MNSWTGHWWHAAWGTWLIVGLRGLAGPPVGRCHDQGRDVGEYPRDLPGLPVPVRGQRGRARIPGGQSRIGFAFTMTDQEHPDHASLLTRLRDEILAMAAWKQSLYRPCPEAVVAWADSCRQSWPGPPDPTHWAARSGRSRPGAGLWPGTQEPSTQPVTSFTKSSTRRNGHRWPAPGIRRSWEL